MLQPKVVVGDLKHIYFIVFNVLFIIYANPVLSQFVGECCQFFFTFIAVEVEISLFDLRYRERSENLI